MGPLDYDLADWPKDQDTRLVEEPRQRLRSLNSGGDEIEVSCDPSEGRHEDNRFPVGRPVRLRVVTRSGRELGQLALSHLDNPEVEIALAVRTENETLGRPSGSGDDPDFFHQVDGLSTDDFIVDAFR